MNSGRRIAIGRYLLVAVGVLGVAGAASGDPTATEPFTYANGALAPNNGGSGWSGGWIGDGTVTTNVASIQGGAAFRTLATPITPTAGQTIYVGYRLGANALDLQTFAGLSFFSGAQEILFMGGSSVYSLNVTGLANVDSTVPLDTSPDYIVTSITFTSATTATVNLYRNPVGVLGAPIATYTGSFIPGAWNRVRLAANTFGASPAPLATFDDIVIGTALSDVVPVSPRWEPFTYADGTLAPNSGGIGWSGAWTGNGTVAGNVASIEGGAAFRALATAITPTAGQSIYVGYRLGASALDLQTFAGLSFFSGAQEILFMGGSSVYSLNVTGLANINSAIPLDESPDYLVTRITFTSATTATVSLYLNPVGSLGAPIATYTGSFIAGTWNRVRLAANTFGASPAPRATFDDLVIGTAVSDVVPALPRTDGFTYANGPLATGAGGNGWSDAWTGNGTVAGSVASIEGGAAFRNLATAIRPTAGQTIYVGYRLGANALDQQTFAGLSFFSGAQEILFMGGSSVYSLNVTGLANVDSLIPLDASPDYIVTRIAFTSSSTATVSLYLNPVGSLGTPIATYTGSFIPGAWDRVRLAANTFGASPAPRATFDNIVISSVLSEVIPAVYTRYLAEGATSAFFDTRLALLNPGNTPTTATLTFLRGGAGSVVHAVPVPARTRVTLDPKTIPGLENAEFSTAVVSEQLLVVDRTMLWSVADHYGAHAETAIVSPETTWYLAEGSTNGGFELFYLLQNPAPTPTSVRVRYLRGAGAPLEKLYTLPASSRTNIWVNVEEFPGVGTALADADISGVIESLDGTPIIVERAMYLTSQGRIFNAGHESAGVTAPARSWFLAEGATGPFFDLFVLVANPNAQAADVRVTYLLGDGRTFSKQMQAPANSRSNIWVDHESFDGGATFPLADVAVSTTLQSTNGVPIIVERAMWWPGDFANWYEGHNSAGSMVTGTRWALAEGEVGGTDQTETYVLIANVSATAGTARVTLMLEDGTSLVRDYALPANSRTNVAVGLDFGAAVNNRRFGVLVESIGPTPAQIVVERAMYSGAGGPQWRAGTNALATWLP